MRAFGEWFFPKTSQQKMRREQAYNGEETVALLHDVEAAAAKLLHGGKDKKVASTNLVTMSMRGLDIFKGALVILMTYSHVDLCLLSPTLTYYATIPHFVGNMASGLCFLGFMLAFGFSCDCAYLSDFKVRTTAQRLERVARSACLPIFAAWITGMAWGFMCFKLPLELNTVYMILDFRLAIGNGPDFLLCFTVCLLTMYPLRGIVNSELASPCMRRRVACGLALLLVPLLLTNERFHLKECTGYKKYLNYLLECDLREPYAPNLPGLPHLFYFNLGVLLSRFTKYLNNELSANREVDFGKLGAAHFAFAFVFLVLSYPLMSVWGFSYGNIAMPTRWGPIIRGFDGGPSLLWLLGNLFLLDVLLTVCIALHVMRERLVAAAERFMAIVLLFPFTALLYELEHLGANVLLYLVVADLCMSGLYRGLQGQFPLGAGGGAIVTFIIIASTRFIHYLGASSRPIK